jgi:hypothetical protein
MSSQLLSTTQLSPLTGLSPAAHSTKTTLDRHLMHGAKDLRARRGSKSQKNAKTYNSGYSLVVTHLTTNPPVRCLNRAERTGSLVFNVLWSYVEEEA